MSGKFPRLHTSNTDTQNRHSTHTVKRPRRDIHPEPPPGQGRRGRAVVPHEGREPALPDAPAHGAARPHQAHGRPRRRFLTGPPPHSPRPPGPRRTALPTQSAPVRRRSIARKRRCAPVMRSSRSPTTEMPAWSATNVPAWFLVFEVVLFIFY